MKPASMYLKIQSFPKYIIMAFLVILKSHTITAKNASTILLCCPPEQWLMPNGCNKITENDQLFSTINVLDPENNQTDTENISKMAYTLLTAGSSIHEIYKDDYANITFFNNGSTKIAINNRFCRMRECCVSPSNKGYVTVFSVFPENNNCSPSNSRAGYGFLVSIVFMVVTTLVYAILPEMHNLHRKSLICFLVAQTISYSFICVITFKPFWEKPFCQIIGFTLYAAILIAFFWLNVVSFDLWWNFRGTNGSFRALGVDKRKFRLYCVYAFGIPTVLVSIAIFMELMSPKYIPSYMKPRMFEGSCFFKDRDISYFVYVYIPIILILISNSTFFVSTALKIRRVRAEIERMMAKDGCRHRKNLENERDRFGVFLRLFLVMGLTWCVDVLSNALYECPDVQYIDWINVLQGPIIFYFLVMKPNVKKLLIKRWKVFRGTQTPNIPCHSVSKSFSTTENDSYNASQSLQS